MESVTPNLTTVLKTYQHRAIKSLQGPGAALVENEAEDLSPPPLPLAPRHPVLSAPDPVRGERGETLLEGELISCFSVGGEKRLCLPQILTSVLTDFSLDQINRVCDELQIYCSRCTPEQLHELKTTGVLPRSAPSCGLITQTDAERLCSNLLCAAAPSASVHKRGVRLSFRVYHKCFGKCRGICFPELYLTRHSPCIECYECHGMFSPQRFVCHAHRDLENRTCHWGFDSSRWKSYLMVGRDEADREKYTALLDDMSTRFDTLKRKQVEEPIVCKTEPPSDAYEVPSKKIASDDHPFHHHHHLYTVDPYALHVTYERMRALSAFRPWAVKKGLPPAYLNRSPPTLQHPERVVRLADETSFESSFQPNVALKPRPPTPPSSDEITSSTSPPTSVECREAKLAAREAELAAREAELAAREARLLEREEKLRRDEELLRRRLGECDPPT